MSQPEITVKKIEKTKLENTKILANVTVSVGPLDIVCNFVEGTQGHFVSFPSRKTNNDRWFSYVKTQDKDFKDLLDLTVIEAYQKMLVEAS